MNLKERILSDIKSTMKERNSQKLSALRFTQAAIKNKEIDMRPKEITDEDVQAVLKTLVKQRKDSIEQYTKSGRKDLVEAETYELSILESYLPEPMSQEEMERLVSQAIEKNGSCFDEANGAGYERSLGPIGWFCRRKGFKRDYKGQTGLSGFG